MSLIAKLLDRLIGQRRPQSVESKYVVVLDEIGISVTSPEGEERQVRRTSLAAVIIETTDTGPFEADLWWLLVDSSGTMCRFPEDATGGREAIEWMMELPGFDYSAMIAAMASVSNARFVCWKTEQAVRI